MRTLFWPTLLLFIFAVLLRMEWAYYLVYVVGGVWLLSYWWVQRSLSKLSVERVAPMRAFAGQHAPVQISITNRSRLPIPWLLFQERLPLEVRDEADYRVALSIGSRSRIEHPYTLDCKQRGLYALGPLSLTLGDLFGFAQMEWREQTTPQILVYPRIVPLHQLGLPSRLPFGNLPSTQRLFEDPARLSGVRPYTSGDSQRRVHWKASAHSDSLLVKKFQPAIALSVLIALDLNRHAYPVRELVGASEWAITVAASLAASVTQARQPVGLLCNGHDPASVAAPKEEPERVITLPPRSGEGQLTSILTRLASVQLSQTSQTSLTKQTGDEARHAGWLTKPLSSVGWGTTLMLVTPRLDHDTLWLLHATRRRGAEIIVLLCTFQNEAAEIKSKAEQLGITVYQVVWEKDLQSI